MGTRTTTTSILTLTFDLCAIEPDECSPSGIDAALESISPRGTVVVKDGTELFGQIEQAAGGMMVECGCVSEHVTLGYICDACVVETSVLNVGANEFLEEYCNLNLSEQAAGKLAVAGYMKWTSYSTRGEGDD